jgi:hypothetical protein
MEKALDAYKALLRELDKFESPSFTVGDFNYFFNSAIEEYISNNYSEFDVSQKSLDDISEIVNIGEAISFTNGVASLPEKYRHILYLEVTLKFISDVDGYAIDDTLVVTNPKRMRTNRKGFSLKNAYQEPSYSEVKFQIAKGNLNVLCGSDAEVISGKIDYIENPETVYLNPDKASNYNDPANNTPLQFPANVVLEIVKHCRKMFLENIESQRYQTSLQEQALRQE